MDLKPYRISSGRQFRLEAHDPADTAGLKKDAQIKAWMDANIERIFALQERLYAENRYSLLIVFQAMDAAGKDGVIKHVFTGLNPQGTQVVSFKQPSSEELDHDYLWRISKALPRRGEIGIFNRSHYEEVIVARVHDLVEQSQLPEALITKDIWRRRYRQIRNFEDYLSENGTRVVKFFLNVSKEEQRKRLLERIERPEKNWKISPSDIGERRFWNAYQKAYQHMIANTSSAAAPWYVVPADHKWFARYLVSEAIVDALEGIDPQFPALAPELKLKLDEYRRLLEEER